MATPHLAYRESREHLLHIAAALNFLDQQTDEALDATAKLIACATGGTPSCSPEIKAAIRTRTAQMGDASPAHLGQRHRAQSEVGA